MKSYEGDGKGLHASKSDTGPLESIKNILGGGSGVRQEDIKTLVILFAFQVLVPGAIKLISYTINSVDVYFNHNSDTILGNEILTPTIIAEPDVSVSSVITTDPILVENIEQIISPE